MSDVTKLVPNFLLQSKVFQSLYNVENQELNAIENAIDDILNQCFLDTAIWGLDLWDKFLGINTKEYTTQERRNILKAKTMSQPPFTKQALFNLLKNFTYDVEIQERYDEYVFDVFLKVKEQLGNKLHYILSWINETKPAHLDYQAIIDYVTNIFITIITNKWYSKELNRCGSIDTSNNQIEIAFGRSYKEQIKETIIKYYSGLIPLTSENLFSNYADGKKFKENILDNCNKYFSSRIQRCSTELTCKEVW